MTTEEPEELTICWF